MLTATSDSGPGYLSSRVLDELRQFTIDLITGTHTERRYSRAKVFDMHFFVAGLSR